MEDEETGRRAIEEMNGKEVDEHVISVCESKNLQGPKIPTMKLAVRNIPESLTAPELRNLFTKYGFVLEAEVRGQTGHVVSFFVIIFVNVLFFFTDVHNIKFVCVGSTFPIP